MIKLYEKTKIIWTPILIFSLLYYLLNMSSTYVVDDFQSILETLFTNIIVLKTQGRR
jgi:hypothetical protein